MIAHFQNLLPVSNNIDFKINQSEEMFLDTVFDAVMTVNLSYNTNVEQGLCINLIHIFKTKKSQSVANVAHVNFVLKNGVTC